MTKLNLKQRSYISLYDLEDTLPAKAIREICNNGDNEAACVHWVVKLNLQIPRAICKETLLNYGYEEEEIDWSSFASLQCHMIWLAAWNRYDRGYYWGVYSARNYIIRLFKDVDLTKGYPLP